MSTNETENNIVEAPVSGQPTEEILQFYDDGFEKRLLAFLVRDKEFFFRNFGLIKEMNFAHQIRRDIYSLSKAYLQKYEQSPPADILLEEVWEFFHRKKITKVDIDDYLEMVGEIYSIDLGSGEKYSEDIVLSFAKNREMKKVIMDGAKLVGAKRDLTPILDAVTNVINMGTAVETPTEQTETCIYPRDAVKGWLKDFADLYSEYLESPYEFWIFNAATCLGNIFSVRIKPNTSLFVEPRLYTACIGTSGDTRKSSCGIQTVHFFKDWAELYSNGEANTIFNSLHGCGSAEGLMDRLEVSPALVLVYDELRSFVQKSSIKGSNLLQMVNSLFELTRYENAVKGSLQQVKDAHLSLLSFCTTETWDSMFTPAFLDIGFINRLWIVPGEGKKKEFQPEAIPNLDRRKLMLKLTRMMENFPKGEVIDLEWSANRRMQDWYESFTRTEFTKRIETYGLILLMIMALSEGKKSIDEEMAERAITLLDWQIKVREFYKPQEYTDTMAWIEGLIRRAVKKNPGLTKGKLLLHINAKRFDSWKVDKALENLRGKEIIERKTLRTSRYWPESEPK